MLGEVFLIIFICFSGVKFMYLKFYFVIFLYIKNYMEIYNMFNKNKKVNL